MAYKTRHIYIKIPNPIKGALFNYFTIRSQQEWKRPDGSYYIHDAYDEDRPLAGATRQMVGDMTFAIHGRSVEERILKIQKPIGRYKSLEGALATLRDMGVLHPDAVKTYLQRYVEGA